MISFKLVAELRPEQISNVNGGSLRENFECNTVHCCHLRLTLIRVTAVTGTWSSAHIAFCSLLILAIC